MSADGKVLRGSRRATLPGLAVVDVVGHELKAILAQAEVQAGEGELNTLLRLLREAPLRGRVVTLDAGLLSAEHVSPLSEAAGRRVSQVHNTAASSDHHSQACARRPNRRQITRSTRDP